MKKLALIMILTVAPANAQSVCLTKHEAQARWPKASLYWHTANRCWDNTPHRRKWYWVVIPLSPKDPLTVR